MELNNWTYSVLQECLSGVPDDVTMESVCLLVSAGHLLIKESGEQATISAIE